MTWLLFLPRFLELADRRHDNDRWWRFLFESFKVMARLWRVQAWRTDASCEGWPHRNHSSLLAQIGWPDADRMLGEPARSWCTHGRAVCPLVDGKRFAGGAVIYWPSLSLSSWTPPLSFTPATRLPLHSPGALFKFNRKEQDMRTWVSGGTSK